ncbi:hypothetical protein D9M71_682580 [compost metagenome]
MGGAVDAQGQATGDHEAPSGQAPGEGARCVQPGSRGAPAAHHGQLRPLQQRRVTRDEQQRWGVGQFAEQGWVGRVVPTQQVVAGLLKPGQGVGSGVANFGAATRVGRGLRQAQGTPGGSRCAECGGGAAEGLQQALESGRAEFGEQMKAQTSFQLGGGD